MPHILKGIVTKVGFMNKTATVSVYKWATHKRTGKRLERSKKYLTHDPENRLQLNDSVLIRSCPPVSARKHFTLQQVLCNQSSAGASSVVQPTDVSTANRSTNESVTTPVESTTQSNTVLPQGMA